MAVYVVIGVVVLAVLVIAYRTLGGATLGDVDSGALMRTATAALETCVGELEGAFHAELAAASAAGRASEGAHAARRRADGAAQLLERADAGSLSPDAADAHALLSVAAHELSWAARLAESEQLARAPGLQAACRGLIDHARACTADAAALLRRSGLPEEREGAAQPVVE